MPLPVTTPADMDRHLDLLGIAEGDRLVVHSRILAFGQLEGGAAMVADRILARIGPGGTLVVPAYTFDGTRVFDASHRPGEATGVLSEQVRQMPGAVRSRCPIHSHAGIGPDARVLTAADPTRSLGPGSDFEHLWRAGFTLVLLGCGFSEGCTYLHHLEAVAEVPYRAWISLQRRVTDPSGQESTLDCRYFARAEEGLTADFEPVRDRLAAEGHLRSAPCPFGSSHACRLEDLHRVGLAMLNADSYALVGGRRQS